MGTGTAVSHNFSYTANWENYEVRLEAIDSEGLLGPNSTEIIQINIQGPPS